MKTNAGAWYVIESTRRAHWVFTEDGKPKRDHAVCGERLEKPLHLAQAITNRCAACVVLEPALSGLRALQKAASS